MNRAGLITFATLFGILTAPTALGDETLRRYPVPLILPPAVAERWADVAQLPEHVRESDDGAALIEIQRPLRAETARVDVFDRLEEGCRWSSAFRLPSDGVLRLPDFGRPRCILIRNGLLYGFAVLSGPSNEVTIDALRDVGPLETDRHYALFLAGEEQPRQPGRDHRFAAVPAAASALLCEWLPAGPEACRVLDPLQTRATGAALSSSLGVRVVRSIADTQVDAWAEGRSVMMPMKQKIASIGVAGWKALTVADSWDRLVVDWSAPGYATVRASGAELPPLPSFQAVAFTPATGIGVRPLVGKQEDRVVEPEARLALFLDRADLAGRIAVAVVEGDEKGVFFAERLAAGEYRMKLVSALAADDVVRAAVGHEITEVRFPAGPIVRGRVVLRSTMTPTALPVIHIVPAAEGVDAASHDPATLVRQVLTGNDGAFRVSLHAGTYVLRATWAGATAERTFDLPKGTKDLDLGEIELGRATTLHGSIARCEGGEIRMIPLPSSSKPPQTAIPFFDVRRAVVQDGRFQFESMWPGDWLASAQCGGTDYLLTPRTVSIPEAAGAELFVQFSAETQ